MRFESDSIIDNSTEQAQSLLYMKNDQGQTALSMAVAKRHDRIIFQLVKRGLMEDSMEGPCQVDEFQVMSILDAWCGLSHDPAFTVLHWAAKEGHIPFVKELLKQEHPIDAEDKEGLTPLHYAAANGYNSEVVAELVRAGAEKDLVLELQGTPLHQAALHAQLDTLRALLDYGCDMHLCSEYIPTPLHVAAQKGFVDFVDELLSRDCPVDIRDKKGRTPLHEAAEKGQSEVVVQLVQKGANKDDIGGGQGTPLHLAACNGHIAALNALLDAGCNACAVTGDGSGTTPLHVAASHGHVHIIQELIRRDCPVDIKKVDGCTPLHDAVLYGQIEAVVELIKYGAKRDVFAENCGTPLHQAVILGHSEMIEILLEGREASIDDLEVLPDGRTPLHNAALYGHAAAAVELIRLGASKEARATFADFVNITPLEAAAFYGPLDTFIELLEEGCSIQPDCNFFLTLSKHQHAEFISELEKCLLQRGYQMDSSQKQLFHGYKAREKTQSSDVTRDQSQLNAAG